MMRPISGATPEEVLDSMRARGAAMLNTLTEEQNGKLHLERGQISSGEEDHMPKTAGTQHEAVGELG